MFHPLWVPKLILNETEAAQRKALSESNRDSEKCGWGNDGLVPVGSAKWGEFLGIVEDCDHWDIRGAQGFSHAWERNGRSGKGGWSEFFRWRGSGDRGHLAVDSGFNDVSQPQNPSKESVSPAPDSPSEKHLREKTQLQAAFKWIVSQVEAQTSLLSSIPVASSMSHQASPHQSQVFGPRFDLERFYIALCRKLYDEGL